MNWIANMRVRKKMVLMNIIAAAFILLVGATGFFFFNLSNVKMADMYEIQYMASSHIQHSEVLVTRNAAALFELMATQDVGRKHALKNEIRVTTDQLDVELSKLSKLPLDKVSKDKIKLLTEALSEAKRTEMDIIMLSQNEKNMEAYQMYQQTLGPLMKGAFTYIDQLSEQRKLTAANVQKDNLKDASVATTIILVITLSALAIGFIVSKVIADMVDKPLIVMTEYMKIVAEGDLSEQSMEILKKAKINKDEIGLLASSVILMRERLHDLILNVSESTDNIAASAEELTANSEQTSAGIEDIADSVLNIAENTDKQMTSVSRSSDALSDISARIQETAANAHETAEVAHKTREATAIGEKAVAAAKDQMNNIEQTVIGLEQMVRVLQARSQEIEGFVGAIVGISQQTNLLALNAAIEAARAGEHGRGFAVVADEVRKLAEDSQNAAKNITELIVQIQSDTASAVSAMVSGSEQVKVGLNVVENAGDAFVTIAHFVENITDQISNVSSATQEMADNSQHAVDAMHELSMISQAVTDQSQSISASVEEQSASMQEIAHASESLAEISETLQNQISNFKL